MKVEPAPVKKSVLVMEDSPHLDSTWRWEAGVWKKNASFGMVIADVTTTYFPKLLCVCFFTSDIFVKFRTYTLPF